MAARLLARGQLIDEGQARADAAAQEAQIQAEAERWGLTVEPLPQPADDALPTFYLWPENLRAFELWGALQTQWRTDMGERTGMDYRAVESELRLGPWGGARQYRRLYSAVKCMERAALEATAQQRAERNLLSKLG